MGEGVAVPGAVVLAEGVGVVEVGPVGDADALGAELDGFGEAGHGRGVRGRPRRRAA